MFRSQSSKVVSKIQAPITRCVYSSASLLKSNVYHRVYDYQLFYAEVYGISGSKVSESCCVIVRDQTALNRFWRRKEENVWLWIKCEYVTVAFTSSITTTAENVSHSMQSDYCTAKTRVNFWASTEYLALLNVHIFICLAHVIYHKHKGHCSSLKQQ